MKKEKEKEKKMPIGKILIVLFCLFLLTGCEQVLTGIGVGVVGSEIVDAYEQKLEEKRIELDNAYDQAIANMQAATDPNVLSFERKKAEQIQIARVANMGARVVISEIKGEPIPANGLPNSNLLTCGLGVLLAWGGNEMRKRKGYEKAVGKLVAEADPTQANHIAEVVKSGTKILG